MPDLSDHETRLKELERWKRKMEDTDFLTTIVLLVERLKTSNDAMIEWQKRQDLWMSEIKDEMKVVSDQTAERRGGTMARKVYLAGTVTAIGFILTVIGLALNALGVFGAFS